VLLDGGRGECFVAAVAAAAADELVVIVGVSAVGSVLKEAILATRGVVALLPAACGSVVLLPSFISVSRALSFF
jgi:hypothetical protein